MNLFSLYQVSKSFGIKTVLDNVTFGISSGEKLGLVGANGSGKSTLLQIIRGLEEVDSGEVHRSNRAKISYLSQEPRLDPENTIFEEVLNSNKKELELIRKFHLLGESLDQNNESQLKELEKLQEEMERCNAWDLENRTRQYLSQVGLNQMDRKVSTLSGGEGKKVALAKLFMEDADCLLLDEPTNHLDTQTIEWLEGMLLGFPGAVLLVTHDRYFLTHVTQKIVELDPSNARLNVYEGNYDKYLWSKAQEIEIENRTSSNQLKFLKRELEWLRKMPRARGTKSKSRVQQFHSVKEAVRFRPKPLKDFQFDISRRLGDVILEWNQLGKCYGERWLFRNSVHKMTNGEKLGIIGKNGAGKSTFIQVLLEKIKADEGGLKKGVGTELAYLDQNRIGLNPEHTVLQSFDEFGEYIPTNRGRMHVKAYLEKFLFARETLNKKVKVLSGGEKARLLLARLVAIPANFLILDEPTNDLDLDTLRLLEEALIAYPGCAVVVSHDRYFLDRVANAIMEIHEEEETPFLNPGNYSHFRWAKENRDKTIGSKSDTTVSAPTERKGKEKTRKLFGYKEKQELEAIEPELMELEEEIEKLKSLLCTTLEDPAEYKSLGENLVELEAKLASKMDRWAELEEFKQIDEQG